MYRPEIYFQYNFHCMVIPIKGNGKDILSKISAAVALKFIELYSKVGSAWTTTWIKVLAIS